MSKKFENTVKQQLDMSLSTLDAVTQSQLTHARYQALKQIETKASWLGWFTGLASMAILTLLVITAMPSIQTQNNPVLATSPEWVLVSDIADIDDIDLYQNLDFYQWLDNTSDSNS